MIIDNDVKIERDTVTHRPAFDAITIGKVVKFENLPRIELNIMIDEHSDAASGTLERYSNCLAIYRHYLENGYTSAAMALLF